MTSGNTYIDSNLWTSCKLHSIATISQYGSRDQPPLTPCSMAYPGDRVHVALATITPPPQADWPNKRRSHHFFMMLSIFLVVICSLPCLSHV